MQRVISVASAPWKDEAIARQIGRVKARERHDTWIGTALAEPKAIEEFMQIIGEHAPQETGEK